MSETPHVVTPVPDPTELTRQLVHHEALQILAKIETRLDGMDKAAEVLSATVNKVPTQLDREMNRIADLTTERMSNIQRQFSDCDGRQAAASAAADRAINAALAAAHDAVTAQYQSSQKAIDKSDAATVKQIDGIIERLNTQGRTLDDKITEVKDRLGRREAAQIGVAEHRTSARMDAGLLVAICAAIIAVIAIVAPFLHH